VQPTEEYIRDNWGGGVYEIRVMGAERGKGMRFKASRKLEVAGDIRFKAESVAPAAPPVVTGPAPEPKLVKRILDDAIAEKRRAEERLERERHHLQERQAAPSQDPGIIQTTLATIERTSQAQTELLQRQLERRDQELAEIRKLLENQRRERSAFEDPEVLKALFSRGADDGARQVDLYRHELQAERERVSREVQAERERVMRELEAARERVTREVQAERERATRELEAERREHEKAVALLERLHRAEVESVKTALGQLVATKDETIQRMTEEVRALRAQTQPHDTLADLERMSKVVTAVKTLVPGLGGEAEAEAEEPSTVERLARMFFDSMTRAPAAAQPQVAVPQPVMALPQVRRAAVPIVPMPATRGVPMVRVPEAERVVAPTPERVEAPAERQDEVPAALLEGVPFLEAALQNGREPVEVARSAISLFGRGDLQALIQLGPDAIVSAIEARAPESILASAGGRRYLAKLIDAVADEFRSG